MTARASLSLHCQLSGITLAINEGAWSATFLTLGALAVIAVAAGTRKHGRMRRSSSRSPTAPPGYAHVVTFSFAKLSDPPC